ncbi:hypothetical protein J7K93_07425 [bacterium]|nr:hypothetical protein [bacterium]
MIDLTGKKKGFILMVFFAGSLFLFACAALNNLRTSTSVVLNKPPNYYGKIPRAGSSTLKVGLFPIVTDIRVDKRDKRIWADLLKDVNRYSNTLSLVKSLPDLDLPLSEFPDVYVGSPEMFGAPVSSSSYDNGDENYIPPMVLYYRNPSASWKEKVVNLCMEKNIDYVLFVTAGLSEYMIRQKNLFGKKELVLGTGYSIPVKWLSSLEDPVDVVHFTGVLVDKTGKIRRSGAEGILAAKKQSLFESAIGLRNSMGSDKIKQITKDIKRDDLSGHPLAYKIALRNLIGSLIGRDDLIVK